MNSLTFSSQNLPSINKSPTACHFITLVKVALIASLVTSVALIAFDFLAIGIAFAALGAGLLALHTILVRQEQELAKMAANIALFKNGMDIHQTTIVDQTLASLEDSSRVQWIADACHLIPDNASAEEKLKILTSFIGLEPSERSRLIPHSHLNSSQKAAIILALSQKSLL